MKDITQYTPPIGYDRERRTYATSQARKEAREIAIDQLVADATKRNDCTDRFYWMLVYDMENAPMTTNAAQLEDIGIIVKESHLWTLINGLADLGVFLLNTNTLTDEEMKSRLINEILTEQVRDLPPSNGVNEFIDMTGGSLTNPDATQICDRDQYLPKVSNEPMEDESETHAETVKKKQDKTSKTMGALATKKAKANKSPASTGGAN